jgi:hypothetical protein
MPAKKAQTLSPEDILASQPPPVASLANRLRTIVRAAVPEAVEAAYPGWRAIGYRHPKSGYFCGIFPLGDHVKLYFEYGAFLPDPTGLLKGATKQTRYVVVRSAKDIKAAPLKDLLEAAVAFREK